MCIVTPAQIREQIIENNSKETEVPVNMMKKINRLASECEHDTFSSPAHHSKRVRVSGKLDDFDK